MHTLTRAVLSIALVCALSLGVGLAPVPAQAQTDDTESIAQQVADLLAIIQDLQAQINDLLGQVGDVQQEIRDAVALTRDLARGMSGDDVEELQELLASDPDIYPEGLVTGFFGPLTEQAVQRLQDRFGIETVGRVGPITRGTINKLFKSHGKNLQSVLLENEDDLDDIDLSEFTPGTTGVLVCHMPPGNPNAAHTIAVGGPAVQAHLGHGDELGACDGDEIEDEDEEEEEATEESAQDAIDDAQNAIDDAQTAIDEMEEGNDKDEAQEKLDEAQENLDDAQDAFDNENWDEAEDLAEDAEELAEDAEEMAEDADTTAPEISNVAVSSITSDSATISWDTDEDSDSTVWYSTDADFEVDDGGVTEVHDGSDVTSHALEIDGLDPDTTYYFIVGSEDSSGNESMSDEDSFDTEA